ncbi:hypothetical protein BH24ACI2_BH24ACI2_14790 [soil metagenome]|nr:TonB family protein [Acidobacteriota bacterium]
MSKLIFTIIVLVSLNSSIFPQTEKYSTPTVWENYSVKDKNVTVQMPKPPVILQGGDVCRGEDTSTFSAYSDGVVYVLKVTSKIKVSEFCEGKRKFDEKNFAERVENLKIENKTAKFLENGNEIKFVDEDKTFKLVNDYENKRWFELQAFGATEAKAEVKNFLDSLKIEEKIGGKEIGKGASRNYGDENVSETENTNKSEENPSKGKNSEDKSIAENIKIIIKPRASYTDAARKANVQGAVRLRVTFLANGGIGSISTVSTLPYGLTEQAIAAASKMFFIPARKNEKPYSVVKTVEYHFSIY